MTEKKVKTIVIATEWSKSPTGRYTSDGKSNGTEFKKKCIIKHLDSYEYFLIDLDGTFGYGSSFLDEAFAGLIRDGLLTRSEFKRRFSFKSDEDPSFIQEIMNYVGDF